MGMPTQRTGIGFFNKPIGTGWVVIVLWVVLAVLYQPAAKAGFVADYTGWLDQMQRYGFWDNINRTHYHGQSLYQFTQFVTWVIYQFFGTKPLPWHYLFITLHAVNAGLLYKFSKGLLSDAAVSQSGFISLSAAVLFCAAPHIAEVVIWEPSFHFLQGLLLILLILDLGRQYICTAKAHYAWIAGFLYLLSSFSLEVFYITPWLVLSMALFYRNCRPYRQVYFSKTITHFLVPLLAIFVLHIFLFRWVYGTWVAHIGTSALASAPEVGLGKPAKHLFNILLLGRFWDDALRQQAYNFCDSTAGIASFYGLVTLIAAASLFYFRTFTSKGKVALLFFAWIFITLVLLIPLWFENMGLCNYDRYTYFTLPFVYLLAALYVSYIPFVYVRVAVVGIYAIVNLRFSIQLSRYWMKSERIISNLLHTFPYAENKKIILLNLSQNMHGIPMIGAETESEFRLMYNGLFAAQRTNATVYDAMAYNMLTPEDGANVTVVDDSTVKVTLTQWGTWWWYGMKGGHSYENDSYKLNLKDPGHWYELTLKQPATGYLLLYEVGNQWKMVDMAKKGVEQR
jgi:hypothetical protein